MPNPRAVLCLLPEEAVQVAALEAAGLTPAPPCKQNPGQSSSDRVVSCRCQSPRLRWIRRKREHCKQQQRCSPWKPAGPTAAQRWMHPLQWALPAPAVHPSTVLQAMADILAGGAPPNVLHFLGSRRLQYEGGPKVPCKKNCIQPAEQHAHLPISSQLTRMQSCQDHCLLQQLAAVQISITVLSVQRSVSSCPCAW